MHLTILGCYMELSIVIPVRNEVENVESLTVEICTALNGQLDYEIIYVDDASNDATLSLLHSLALPQLRVIRHTTPCGQSTAIHTGVHHAKAAWIVTLDGDGQNDPADIPALWHLLQKELQEKPTIRLMIAGVRVQRQDDWAKRKASDWANKIRRKLLQDGAHDTGCGLKLFSKTAFLSWPYFDHMHRFMPTLNHRHGGRLLEIEVKHRPRGGGQSNYRIFDRLWVGIFDLIGVMWLLKRTNLPDLDGDVL